MSKRIYSDLNKSVEHPVELSMEEWVKLNIKEWSVRSIEITDELAAMRKSFIDWKFYYIAQNIDRVDYEADDLWSAKHFEYYNERDTLLEEMAYLKMCVEDEVIKCPL